MSTVHGRERLGGEGKEERAAGEAPEPVVRRTTEEVPVRRLVHRQHVEAVHEHGARERHGEGEARMSGPLHRRHGARPEVVHDRHAAGEEGEDQRHDRAPRGGEERGEARLEEHLARAGRAHVEPPPDALAVDPGDEPREQRAAKSRDDAHRPRPSARACASDATSARQSGSTTVIPISSSSASTSTAVAMWKGSAGPPAKTRTALAPPAYAASFAPRVW